MTFGETRLVQWWVRLVGAILLLLLIFLAYARVGAAGFIWDDESHLTQNPCIIGPLGLADIWTSASAFYYPLVLTTLLDSSSFCRAKSPALSHPQRHISRRIGAAALARPRSIARARCLARRSNLGVASGAGAIGRVGHRNEEHAVGLLLPACYFLLFTITRS